MPRWRRSRFRRLSVTRSSPSYKARSQTSSKDRFEGRATSSRWASSSAEVSAITDLPAIHRYADRKAHELLTVLDVIRKFRDTVSETSTDEAVNLIAKRAPEPRR